MPHEATNPDQSTQPLTPLGELSLAEVLQRISNDPDLAASKRRYWCWCLRKLSKLLDKNFAQMPARLLGLRYGIERLHHAQAGISRKTLQNLRSTLKAILRYVGALHTSTSYRTNLSPQWRRLFDSLSDVRAQRSLSRFIRYCSATGIAPNEVSDAVIEEFIQAARESSFDLRENVLWRETCRFWNSSAETQPGWPAIMLTVPNFRQPTQSIAWDRFPETFPAHVEEYLTHLADVDFQGEDGPARPCKPSTIEVRRRDIHLAASAAVKNGIPIARLTSLAELCSPDVVKAALYHYLAKYNGETKTFVIELAARLVSLARWAGLSEVDIAELKRYSSMLERKRRSGLTPKNMEVLRAFRDPGNQRRLRALPRKLMAEATKIKARSFHKATIKAQLAVAIQILMVAPMRIGNIAALSLETNVIPVGMDGIIHLYVPFEDVKNSTPLEHPLPRKVSEMLDLYRREFRHRLHGSNAPWLFPGENGEHKRPRTLSEQITGIIEKELGIHLTPHQFRHLAAALLLMADPGNYELVRRVLGHKNIQTTINFYVGLENIAATEQFANLVMNMDKDEE